MIRISALSLCLFLVATSLFSQKVWVHKEYQDWESKAIPAAEPEYSLFLIGDAGKPASDRQEPTFKILQAAMQQRGEQSMAIFLGDNIYPYGLPDSDEADYTESRRRILEQVKILDNYPGKAVFVPGNHDWAQGRKQGFHRIRNLKKFFRDSTDRDKLLLPEDGCPGPVEVELSQDLLLILIDTQWFLHKWDKPDHQYDCQVKYNADFYEQLEGIIRNNKDRKIVVAGHHPMYSYGAHGGHFPISQHIFPLTMGFKNAYIPLPVIGSIAPLQRKLWGNIQDIPHPIYKEMRDNLVEIFQEHPNLTYVCGHDHNLQYLPIEGNHYVVSGAGAKHKWVSKGKKAHFTYEHKGYARLDYYDSGEVWLSFHVPSDSDESDQVVYRELIYTQEPFDGEKTEVRFDPDLSNSPTVTTHADDRYEAGGFRRWALGKNYREEWITELEVPLLQLTNDKSGYLVLQRGGGHQTRSLRLEDAQGRHYALRSVIKFPDLALPEILRGTVASTVLQDQISASHTYSAFVIPDLASAAGVYHTNPKLVYIPDDPALGEYREDYGGMMALFEERPAGDRSDIESFGRSKKIVSTLKMLEKMRGDNDHLTDGNWSLRSRLFDIWLGDWDRHDDQWRWASFKEDGKTIYRPIPRDRDQAFFMANGFAHKVAFRKWALRQIQSFEAKMRDVKGLGWAAMYWDRTFLVEPDWDAWQAEIEKMQAGLSDEVIVAALKTWPSQIYDLHGEEIAGKLKARRDAMLEWGREYYEFLAKKVEVLGSDKKELFKVERLSDEETRVRVWKLSKKGKKKHKLYDRRFVTSETREIRLYGFDGKDQFELEGEVKKGPKIRIIGGKGKDEIKDESKVSGLVRKTIVYDRKKNTKVKKSGETRVETSTKKEVNDYDRYAFKFNYAGPLVSAGFNVDDGIFIGGGFQHRSYGFRKDPFASSTRIMGNYAFATGSFNAVFAGRYPQAVWGWDLDLRADVRSPNYISNFFGLGNESIDREPDNLNFSRVRFQQVLVNPSLGKTFLNGQGTLDLGLMLQSHSVDTTFGSDRFITDFDNNGLDPNTDFERKTFVGPLARIELDSRDDQVFPRRGAHLKAQAAYNLGLNSNAGNFSSLHSSLSLYFRFRIPLETVLALRVGGGTNSGDAPFYLAQQLGARDNLRGFRRVRFAGDASLYQNTDLRIRLFDFRMPLFPGSFGIMGLNDFGRVWLDGENSSVWHHSYGGGLWVTPFDALAISATYSFSDEGGFPFVRVGFMF